MKTNKKYSWVFEALKEVSFIDKTRATKQFLMNKKDYLPKKKTNADLDLIIKCALCPNMCRFDCPVSEVSKKESLAPSGKSRLVYLYETERVSAKKVMDQLYSCCNCDACKQWCPFDFSLGDLLIGVHQDLMENNYIPKNIVDMHDKLQEKYTLDERNVKIQAEKKGENLYFMGCNTITNHQEIVDSVTSFFKKNNESYTIIKDEWCCGSPLYKNGFMKDFKKFAKHNVEKIKESGCKKIICSCPACTYIFKKIYPELGLKIEAEILHISEYFYKKTNNKKIGAIDSKKEFVYHDPCTLVRKLNIIEEPRKVLENIPGLKLKYPYYSEMNTQCCGRGGTLKYSNQELSEKITKKRIEELKKDGKYVITACPTCKTAFCENGFEAFDISEILMMGVEKTNE